MFEERTPRCALLLAKGTFLHPVWRGRRLEGPLECISLQDTGPGAISGRTALHAAAASGSCKSVEALIELGARTDAQDIVRPTSPLRPPASQSMPVCGPGTDCSLPLRSSSGGCRASLRRARNGPCVAPTLQMGGRAHPPHAPTSDPSSCLQNGRTPLYLAAVAGHADCVQALIAAGLSSAKDEARRPRSPARGVLARDQHYTPA